MDPKTATQLMEKELQKLMETSMGRRAFLGSLSVLLASCASNEKTRFREGDNTGQISLTVKEEEALTAKVKVDLQQEYPPITDKELQDYVKHVGQNLVAANDLDGNPYHYSFTAVDVPYVNAFALPAGTVYITAPLIAMADSEAELAGVMGHEIGHVKARHAAERMAQAERNKKRQAWWTVGGGIIGGAVGLGLGTLICRRNDQKCLVTAAGLGAAAGAGGTFLIQKYAFMANTREDEMEADRIGFRTAVKAGYDKREVGRFYSKLLQVEDESKRSGNPVLSSLADAMSTHPPSWERVNQMADLTIAEPDRPSVTTTKAFSRAKRLASAISEKARARKSSGA